MKYKYSTSSKNEHKAQLHLIGIFNDKNIKHISHVNNCLLYTSDAADEP